MNRPAFFPAALSALAALLALPVLAQSAQSEVELGRQIANNGTQNGVAACASCHGAQGEGNAAGGFPRIAGQSQAYMARQLSAYARDARNNPVMAAIASAMTPQQIAATSTYYATLAAPSTPPAEKASADAMARGRMLAEIGDEKIAVQACANCHGPGGSGEPPTYPYLAGQHGGYLSSSLQRWKNGTRKTDPSQQMNMIASRLSDGDIAALSAYFSSQPAPQPAVARMNIPASAGAASGSSGAQPSVPASGTGSEQGAATSGGGQGPGGGGASGAGPSGSRSGNAQ